MLHGFTNIDLGGDLDDWRSEYHLIHEKVLDGYIDMMEVCSKGNIIELAWTHFQMFKVEC